MQMLNEYLVPVIVALCLATGYIIKHWIKDADNKIIPTVVTLTGMAAAIAMNWGAVTVEIIVSGAVSGLASTGLHQMFKQWIDSGIS
ncbi:MAG: phage holin family protein [Oscillospiraceae bacterium]|nr:phage holin family protein [Oscillospiraceae bacterium]